MGMRKAALLYINGQRHEVSGDKAGMMLADYLRYEAGLTGTKIVCAEGDCGACTVLRAFPSRSPEYLAINSCIATVAQLDGSSLVSVDALARGEKLSPVQSSMMNCHGSQCGFCTPGFVMALAGLVEKKIAEKSPTIDEREAKNALTGNLCRCTGYQPIIDAATSLKVSECESVRDRFLSAAQARELKAAAKESLTVAGESFELFAPTSVKEAVKFLSKNPEARLLGAATDLGVFHNKWKKRLERVVSLHLVSELYEIKSEGKTRVRVGARVTLSELREFLKTRSPEMARFLDLFASPQIKNIATLVGNVANASPIADTPPFLLVSEAIVELRGPKGKRTVPIEEFFLDYRKTAVRKGELIAAISFATEAKGETLALRKVSERKDLDISAVNAAFRVKWSKGRVAEARLALGGVAATAVRLKKAEAAISGRELDARAIDAAVEAMHDEIAPIADVRGSAAFRRVLCENLLRGFFAEAPSA